MLSIGQVQNFVVGKELNVIKWIPFITVVSFQVIVGYKTI